MKNLENNLMEKSGLKVAKGLRPHIGFYGLRNVGKSTLFNSFLGESVAVVSDTPGTTTDPVIKNMELRGLGAITLMDTAGLDDEGDLGELRIEKTIKTLEKCDLAIFLFTLKEKEKEIALFKKIKEKGIKTIAIASTQEKSKDFDNEIKSLEEILKEEVILISLKDKKDIYDLYENVIDKLKDFEKKDLLGNLVKEGDLVLLCVPQDIQAPKGRLILPQVMTIRELLDRGSILSLCTENNYKDTLKTLKFPPKLIITDSKVFKVVHENKPRESMITSFSVLFAAFKGDLNYFKKSVYALENLPDNAKILVAEACSHPPGDEDIGTVKIPEMIRKKYNKNIEFKFVRGDEFPDNLKDYDLIIHCGACMFNRTHVLRRSEKAKALNVPMSNYGLVLAFLQGIIEEVVYPE